MTKDEWKEEVAWYWNRFLGSIKRPFRWLRRHIFNQDHRHLVKTAITFEPWDWTYLMNLERAALVQMVAYHRQSQTFVGWDRAVREMETCIRLIDIITEDVELTTGFPDYKFCRAFNYKNMGRWAIEAEQVMVEKSLHKGIFMESIYRKKAEYLYHKIRAEREQTWWD